MLGPYGLGFPQPDSPADEGWKLFITAVTLVILSGLFVVARFWVREYHRSIGSDDSAILLSMIFSLLCVIFVIFSISWGFGIDEASLPEEHATEAMQWYYLTEVFFNLSIMCSKVSMLLLYLRIFVTQRFRQVCYGTIGVVLAWSFASIFTLIFQCIPVQATWNLSLEDEADCINLPAWFYQYGVMSVLTDIWILILPIRAVRRLQTNSSNKWGVTITFMLGFSVCAFCIARLTVEPWNDSYHGSSMPNRTGDYLLRPLMSMPEMSVAIICACLPTLHLPRFVSRKIEAHGSHSDPESQNQQPASCGSRGGLGARVPTFSATLGRGPGRRGGGFEGSTNTTVTAGRTSSSPNGAHSLSSGTTMAGRRPPTGKSSLDDDDIELGLKTQQPSPPSSSSSSSPARDESGRPSGLDGGDHREVVAVVDPFGGTHISGSHTPQMGVFGGSGSDENLLSRMQDLAEPPSGDILVTYSYDVRTTDAGQDSRDFDY